mgnify:CR=1 FL=1
MAFAQDALASFNEYWTYHKSIPVDVFPNHNNPDELHIAEEIYIDFFASNSNPSTASIIGLVKLPPSAFAGLSAINLELPQA